MRNLLSNEECRRVLGVPADASAETIRQAYLDLARVWHPDRFQGDERLRRIAEEHLREFNEAYAFLKKPCSAASRPRPACPRPEPANANSQEFVGPVRNRAPEPETLLRRPGFWGVASRSVAKKAAWAGIGVMIVSLPFLAVIHLVGLHIPALDSGALRVIESRTAVLGAGLTRCARGGHAEVWMPEGYSAPRGAVRARRRGSEPPAHAQAGAVGKPAADVAMFQTAPFNSAEPLPAWRQAGAGELRVSNHTGQEAVFRLVSEHHTHKTVYVAPDGIVTLPSIPVGVYDLYVEFGKDLDRNSLRFLRDRSVPAPLGPFQFTQITTDAGMSGNHYDVELKPL
jgi:hypothetical protein